MDDVLPDLSAALEPEAFEAHPYEGCGQDRCAAAREGKVARFMEHCGCLRCRESFVRYVLPDGTCCR